MSSEVKQRFRVAMVQDSHRRKWDKAEWEKIARDQIQAERDKKLLAEVEKPTEYLRPRDFRVDLDQNLHKSLVVTKSTPLSAQGGYYCKVCDCTVKDSTNFLDHINGRKHMANLGFTMKIPKSSVEDVKKRFEFNKLKVEQKSKQQDIEETIKEIKEEEDKLKDYKKSKGKKRKLAVQSEADNEMDPAMAEMMGFSGFGGKK